MIEFLEFVFRDTRTALGVAALVILGITIPAALLSRALAYFAPFRGLVQYRRVDFHPTDVTIHIQPGSREIRESSIFTSIEKTCPGGSDRDHFHGGPDPGDPSGDQ